MRIAFVLILFFLGLNIAAYLVVEMELLPIPTSPYADPTTIATSYLTVPLSLAAMGVLVLAGILARNPLITVAGLMVFAVDRLLPFGSWAITGFPTFLGQIGVPAILTGGLQMLFYFVWFWAIMQFLSGRLDIG